MSVTTLELVDKLLNSLQSDTNKRSLKQKTLKVLDSRSLLNFALLLGNLKKTPRTGWIRNGISSPESISDHMYRMSMLAWILGDQINTNNNLSNNLNINKMIKMSLIHDIIESIVGDIVPIERISGISKKYKHELELSALNKIKNEYLKNTNVANEIYNLWNEFEDGKTNEAKLVRDLDKLDMIIQAEEYETEFDDSNNINLSEFFKHTRGIFKNKITIDIDKELILRRQTRLNNKYKNELLFIFVIGCPFSGKTTQCKLLYNEFNKYLNYINLNKLISNNTSNINSNINSNNKVLLLSNRISSLIKLNNNKLFIIDNFPSNINDLKCWNENKILNNFPNKILFLLSLDCSDEKCIENSNNKNNKNILLNNISLYKQSIIQIIHCFGALNKLKRVSAMNSINETYKNIRKLVIKYIN